MPWVAAVAGGVASLGGAMTGASATRKAGEQSAQATREATALQREQWQRQLQEQAPWREAGVNALTQLQSPELTRSFTAADLAADPIYQQMMAQGLATGEEAIGRQMAARGGFDSGARLKELTRYGQGLAASEGLNAFNRFTGQQGRRLGAWQSQAGLGQTANQALGSAGSQYAANVGQLGLANAATQGNVGMTQANLWGSAAQGIGQNIGDWYQRRQQSNQQTSSGGDTNWNPNYSLTNR